MVELLKKFFKDISVYSIEPIFSKGIVFLLIPLYTSYLSTADYGNLELILTFGTFYFTIIELGLLSSYWKFRIKSEKNNEGEVIYNIFYLIILVGGIILIIFFILKFFIENSTFSLYANFILIIFLAELLRKIFTLALTIFRAKFWAKKYVFASILYVLLFVGFNIFFIVFLKLNFVGIILGYFFSAAIVFFIYFRFIRQEFVKKVNTELIKKMLRYGMPIMVGNLFAIVITLSSRFFLKELSTDVELGQYSYGFKFGNLIRILLINSFFLVWNPMRWEIYEMKNGKEIFAKFYKLLFVMLPSIAFLFVGIILTTAPFITMNDKYLDGFKITLIIGMSFVLHGLYYFNAMGMLFENKTNIIMYIIISSGIINLLLNYVLIPYWGIIGAASAMFISYLVMLFLGAFFSQKFYKINRVPLSEIGGILLLIIFTSALTYLFFHIKNISLVGLIISIVSIIYFFINSFIMNITVSDMILLKRKILKSKNN
jgi:O-antigen/teichoic acid export membrane protein